MRESPVPFQPQTYFVRPTTAEQGPVKRITHAVRRWAQSALLHRLLERTHDVFARDHPNQSAIATSDRQTASFDCYHQLKDARQGESG